MDLKEIVKNIAWKRLVIGFLIGTIIGYAYYYFIGCESGTCRIQSDPINMTLYGAFAGAVLFFRIKKDKA